MVFVYNSSQLVFNNMDEPVVSLQDGKVKGKLCVDFLGGEYYSFVGIPYAKPPIGELRFKAPEPVEPWTGIRDATKEGPGCPSQHMLFDYYVGSEDNCLNLNVYTSELPNNCSVLKPVMVWIHGGGFVFGSNKRDLYSPDYLITEDIVLVCINYRLGVLGFLSLEDSSLEVPGNAGLKDMVLALHWVQKNIDKFCGDPNNVTIFGQSAGAVSVHYLLLSPMSKGLFHKAIAQSGCSLNNWSRGCSNGTLIAKYLGYEETDEKKILEYLKKIPARTIVKTLRKIPEVFSPSTIRPFGPVVEKLGTKNAFLCEEPIEVIKSGNFHHVPLIMGYTSNEGMFLQAIIQMQMKLGIQIPKTNFENEILHSWKQNVDPKKYNKAVSEIKKYYYQDEDPSERNIDKYYALKTDNMFFYEIHQCVSHQKLVSKAPIYFYKMTLDTTNNHIKRLCTTTHIYILMALYFLISKLNDGFIKNFLLKLSKLIPQTTCTGTCHADDLGYLFKTFMNEKFDAENKNNIHVMRFIRIWANFARTGNPTPDKNDSLIKIKWPPVTAEKNILLNIDDELKIEIDPDLERADFWKNLYSM